MTEYEESYDDQLDESFASPGNPQDRAPKKRRRRAALSCSACKQRKIKCSRTWPCTACIARGASDECRWADLPQQPTSSFVTGVDFDAYRSFIEGRLNRIEEALRLKDGDERPFTASLQREVPKSINGVPHGAYTNGAKFTPSVTPTRGEDAAESAALALEDLAVSTSAMDLPNMTIPENATHEQFAINSLIDRTWTSPCETIGRFNPIWQTTPANLVDVLQQVISSSEEAAMLLQVYEEYFAWAVNGVVITTFRMEAAAFWQLSTTADKAWIDPAWIAVYASILSFGARLKRNKQGDEQADQLYVLAKYALSMAKWEGRPQIRIIQACVVLMWHQLPDSSAMIYHVVAYRTAQMLKLDKLGSDPELMPPADRALPTGTLLAREFCSRLWWQVVCFDWLISYAQGCKYFIHPGSFDTAAPRNFSDDDLMSGPVHREPRPVGSGDGSEIFGLKAMISEYVRRLTDLGPVPVNGDIDKFYARLVELDKEAEKSGARLHASQNHKSLDPKLDRWLLIALSFDARRLRLHRYFSLRGYNDPKYRYSTEAVLECAQKILVLTRNMTSSVVPTVMAGLKYADLLLAVIAIYTDVYWELDQDSPQETIEAKLANMSAASEALRGAEASADLKVKEIGLKGRLMLAALGEHIDERRNRRHRGEENVDVAEIFNRINARVTKEAAFTMQIGQVWRRTANSSGTSSLPCSAYSNASEQAAQEVQNYMDNLGLLPPRLSESPVQLGYPGQQSQQQQNLRQPQQQVTPYLHFSPDGQVPGIRLDRVGMPGNGPALFDPMSTIMPSLPSTTACWWDGISGAASSQDYSDLNTFNFAANDAAWYGI